MYGKVWGLCDGSEVGLLPGALIRNASLRFESRDVRIRVERVDTVYTHEYAEGQVLCMPIAHGDGNYEADGATLERLEGDGRIVFRYVDAGGTPTEKANPNGSWHNIAGLINEEGNVLGMMPHPERAMEALLGSTDGIGLFASLASSFAAVAG